MSFFKKIRRKLKKVVKSKAFKIVAGGALIATGVGAAGGLSGIAGTFKSSALFRAGSSFIARRAKSAIQRKLTPRSPRPPPTPQQQVQRFFPQSQFQPQQQFQQQFQPQARFGNGPFNRRFVAGGAAMGAAPVSCGSAGDLVTMPEFFIAFGALFLVGHAANWVYRQWQR